MNGYGPVSPDEIDGPEDGPQGAEWLGHRDNCSLQWSPTCDCNDCPRCGLPDGDHMGGCPESGTPPQPGAPG